MSCHSLCFLAIGLIATSSSLAGQTCFDDAYEDNDTCQTPFVIGPGDYPGLVAMPDDYDYFKISVPSGERLSLEITVEFDLFLTLHDAATTTDCSFAEALDTAWLSDLAPQTIHWANLSGTTREYIVGILPFVDCTHYDLRVSLAPDLCGALADTGILDNHDCASAAALGVGQYPGQFVSHGNSDFLRIDVQPAELFAIDVIAPWGSTGFPLWISVDEDCAPPVYGQAVVSSLLDRRRFHLFNQTAAPQTYTVEIERTPDPSDPFGFCSDYDLEITSEFDPHGIYAGDEFEPNDSCNLAAPIDDGRYSLSASMLNQDWFSLTVEPGATLSYSITPESGPAWVSHLRSDCSGSVGSFLANVNPVAPGASRAALSWTNTDPTPADVNFFVLHSSNTGEFCGTYELDLRHTQGEVFCSSTPNSTGLAARIDASGSTDVNLGSLELSAVNVPAYSFGLFFCSPNEVSAVPFGNGLRCLGAPFVRLPVTYSGPSAVLRTTIDWSAPGNAAAIDSGSTWSFQAWYRDSAGGGAQYDLSDGLRIGF